MPTVRVLGPVEVIVDGHPVDLGGALPRRLLAALALDADRVVPDDRLGDAMWGPQPPPKARVALQTYVSRLRAALGPHGDRALERGSGGYRLRVESLDITEFDLAVADGRRALAAGDAAAAVATLAAALATWRGEPFADLAPSEIVDAARGRLLELRALAEEELAAARLAAGDTTGAVADLTEMVRAAPLRERRWALLVLGLYRGGRQGEALGALRRARAVLADELGVDPGPELRELERRVLAQDTGLDLTRRAEPVAPPARQRVRRPLTSLHGRAGDLAAVAAALTTHRLVTLVGTAGVGKTRVAVEHVARVTGAPNAVSVWFARLADVREPAELPTVVAAAIGLPAVIDDPAAATIRALSGHAGVLVLDNCEHVTEAAAELALALLDGCPDLRILATSRAPLGIDGEITLPVAPLPSEPAVALLADRVAAVRPDWAPTAEETVAAQRIVAALDGLPLAIELAAARARLLGITEIAERLDDRFALLGRVPRGSVTEHPTLDAAIGWSVDLLDDPVRAMLLRLWPFEGGFTLAAAAAVGPDGATAAAPLELLSALVTRSVVVADTSSSPTRYLLLESIRAYCRSIDPEPDAARVAHARWVRRVAAGCITEVRAGRGGRYLADLTRELPNIRTGLAHDLVHDPAAALDAVGCLGLFLTRRMHNVEAERWGRAALAAAPDGDPVARGRILCAINAVRFIAGDHETAAAELLPEIEANCAVLDEDDPLELCDQHYLLGFAAVMAGLPDLALAASTRAITVAERTGVRSVLRPARAVLGVALVTRALQGGADAAMLAAAHDVRAIARGWTGAWAEAGFGEAHLRCPADAPDAVERARVALAALRGSAAAFQAAADVPFGLSALYLGVIALARIGRTADAEELLAAVRGYGQQLGIEPFAFLGTGGRWFVDELAALRARPAVSAFDWDRAMELLAVDRWGTSSGRPC